ncbi:hypothetical protein KAJ41_01745 [Candidatus Parcubacteria bacterium]|nr:hypothetical protein [Candidatus Parcubacteria bacterium]
MKIKGEKHEIGTIVVATDHRLARDRWLNIKRALDVIYEELFPLKDDQQTISISNT